jgi:hypothetical protein
MVLLTRLFAQKKENLNKIFMIKDPVFISLILKMTSQLKKLKHNQFALRDPNIKTSFVSDQDFCVAPEKKLIFSMKKTENGSINSSGMVQSPDQKIKKRESILLKKIRLSRTETVFDTMTISADFISTIDELIKCLDIGKPWP